MAMDLQRAAALEREAEQNDSHCSHCEQTIKVYRYGISDSMVRVLRAMAGATDEGSGRSIDVDSIDLKHSERTQLTKMRFHGLVAKVKEDGRQIPRHWLITRKGWQFLGKEPVPAKVIVYNNQVLGHDGGTITIDRIGGGAGEYDETPISEAESRTYAHIREPQWGKLQQATYLGMTGGKLQNGTIYDMKMDRLQVGKPIKIIVLLDKKTRDTAEYEFKDVAAFAKTWQVVA